MNCEEVERQDIVGAYIAGKLPEEVRDRFEEHYFGCDLCLQQVECARVARDVLATRRPAESRKWLPWLAIAAALIAAVGIWKAVAPKQETAVVSPQAAGSPDRTQTYQLLARFDPPPYKPSNLRGAENSARQFREAMKQYSVGDFAAAVVALRSTVAAKDSLTEARYYLALSEVLSGERNAGIGDLKRVIADGDTPYQSEARFYLAKALLAANNASGARQQLETLVSEKSELAARATEILNQLPKP
jgi:hypothetical protein